MSDVRVSKTDDPKRKKANKTPSAGVERGLGGGLWVMSCLMKSYHLNIKTSNKKSNQMNIGPAGLIDKEVWVVVFEFECGWWWWLSVDLVGLGGGQQGSFLLEYIGRRKPRVAA